MNQPSDEAAWLHEYILQDFRNAVEAKSKKPLEVARQLDMLDRRAKGGLSRDLFHREMVAEGLPFSRSNEITRTDQWGDRKELIRGVDSADFADNGRILIAHGGEFLGVVEPDGTARAIVHGERNTTACFDPTASFAAQTHEIHGVQISKCAPGARPAALGRVARYMVGDTRVLLAGQGDRYFRSLIAWPEEGSIHLVCPRGSVVRFSVDPHALRSATDEPRWDTTPDWYLGHREIVAPAPCCWLRAMSSSGRFFARAVDAENIEVWNLDDPSQPIRFRFDTKKISELIVRNDGALAVLHADGKLLERTDDDWREAPYTGVVAFAWVGPEAARVVALADGRVLSLDGPREHAEIDIGFVLKPAGFVLKPARLYGGQKRSEFVVVSASEEVAFLDFRVWREATCSTTLPGCKATYPYPSERPEVSLSVNAVGSYIALWVHGDSAIRVVETETFHEVARLDRPWLKFDANRTTWSFGRDGKSIHYLSRTGQLMTWRFTESGEQELVGDAPPEGLEWMGVTDFGGLAIARACSPSTAASRASESAAQVASQSPPASEPRDGSASTAEPLPVRRGYEVMYAEWSRLTPHRISSAAAAQSESDKAAQSEPGRSAVRCVVMASDDSQPSRGWIVWDIAGRREIARFDLPSGEVISVSPCGTTAYCGYPAGEDEWCSGWIVGLPSGETWHTGVGRGRFTPSGAFWVGLNSAGNPLGMRLEYYFSAWDCREGDPVTESRSTRWSRSPLRLVRTPPKPCVVYYGSRIVPLSNWPTSGLTLDDLYYASASTCSEGFGVVDPGGRYRCWVKATSTHPTHIEVGLAVRRTKRLSERYWKVSVFLDEIDRAKRLLSDWSPNAETSTGAVRRAEAIAYLRDRGIGFDAAAIAAGAG